jgi:hypothetical protein
VIINYELSALRSAIVQAAEAHAKGRAVAAPAQMGTAAVNYMTAAFAGKTAVATVVTLSQARKCGWETWFACTYAQVRGGLDHMCRAAVCCETHQFDPRRFDERGLGGCKTYCRTTESGKPLPKKNLLILFVSRLLYFQPPYAEDVAKLRMPTSGRTAKATNVGKAMMAAAAMAETTRAALERTPPAVGLYSC